MTDETTPSNVIPIREAAVVTPAAPPDRVMGIVTMFCHTMVLITAVIAVVLLAGERSVNPSTFTASMTLLGVVSGITGHGLATNGRKYSGTS